MLKRWIVLDEEVERVVRDGNSQKHEVDRLEWPDLRKFLVWLMNFRRDGASRSFEAMVWISEIASAKSIAELKTSKNHYWSDFEVLDSEIASGFKTLINWDFEIGVAIDEQCSQTDMRCLTGRQVAWMIYTNLKASDTDESVLDSNEIVNVGLESDIAQSFNTRLDEIIISMERKTTWNFGKSVESSFEQLELW